VRRPRHQRARGAGGVRRREEGGRVPPRGPDRLPQTALGQQGRPAWPTARRWRSGAWPGDLPTPGHGHPPRGPVADPAGVRPVSRRGWRRREGMAAGGRDTAPDRAATAGRWRGRGAPHSASRTRRRSGAAARGWTGLAPGRRPRARGARVAQAPGGVARDMAPACRHPGRRPRGQTPAACQHRGTRVRPSAPQRAPPCTITPGRPAAPAAIRREPQSGMPVSRYQCYKDCAAE
jgi:hypothetical protein